MENLLPGGRYFPTGYTKRFAVVWAMRTGKTELATALTRMSRSTRASGRREISSRV